MAVALIITIGTLYFVAFVILLWPLLSKGSDPLPPQKTARFGDDYGTCDLEGPDPEYLRRHLGPDASCGPYDHNPGGGSHRH